MPPEILEGRDKVVLRAPLIYAIIVQTARAFKDLPDVICVNHQRSPQNAPLVLPPAECAFNNLSEEGAEVVVIPLPRIEGILGKWRDDVTAASKSIVAHNAPT